jgi:hypothetical protein
LKVFGKVVFWAEHLLPEIMIYPPEKDGIHVASAHDMGTGALLQAALLSSSISLRLELAEVWIRYLPTYVIYDQQNSFMGETIKNFCARFSIHVMDHQGREIKKRVEILHNMSRDILVTKFLESLPKRTDGRLPQFDVREISVLWLHHQINAKKYFENILKPNGRDMVSLQK